MTTIATPPKPRKKKIVVREATMKRNLRCTFTRDERLELAQKLAEHHNTLVAVQDEKSRAMKDYASRIKGIENDIGDISRKVTNGYEFRDIDCRVQFDVPEAGKKTIVRLDSKDVVGVESMTHEEKQLPIPAVDEAIAKEKERQAAAATPTPPSNVTPMPLPEDGITDADINKAIGVLKVTKRASTSMIQRRLGIGYNRAVRLLEELEKRKVVGPEKGSSPREILVDLEKYGQPAPKEPKKRKSGKPGVVNVPADGQTAPGESPADY